MNAALIHTLENVLGVMYCIFWLCLAMVNREIIDIEVTPRMSGILV